METKKRVGYRIIKKFGRYHLYLLMVNITWKLFGLWGSKYYYNEAHSDHCDKCDALKVMNTLIEAEPIVVTSDDYDLKGNRINSRY